MRQLHRQSLQNIRLFLKRSRAPDKLACQGRRERLQQAPGAFAPPGFGGGLLPQPPKVGNGTRRLQKRGTSGACYSFATIHKYMNTELGLRSAARLKRPDYEHGKPHKVFPNRLNQNFTADEVNQKWCIDFTYLFLKDHEVRYNCTIIDLHDRSVIASITDHHISSDLAIRILQKALDSQPAIKGGLILHSDQGSQYTSKTFTEFCESVNVTQSMSKAGYPYDNAPMERYFNTLKNECINLYEYETEDALYQAVEDFSYVEYNYVRPHSYNGYATPHQARVAA